MALTNTQTNVDQLTINVVNTYSTFSNMSVNENELYFIKEDQGAKIYYATCTTAADQFKKIATIEPAISQFTPEKGTIVAVKYNNTNTANASAKNGYITLNINGTGDKNIYYNNTSTPTGTNTNAFGYEGRIVYYMYDGTYWVWLNHSTDNNTTYSEISITEASNASSSTARLLSGRRLQATAWSLQGGTEIPEGADLNSYTTFGNYYQGSNNIAHTIINNPYGDTTSLQAFQLKIISSTGSGTEKYIRQELYEYDKYHYFVRISTNGGSSWSAWLPVAKGNSKVYSGICSTAATVAAKEVVCNSYPVLTKGDIVFVTFNNTNSKAVADLTLNVNNTGAKPIKCFRNGKITNLPGVDYLAANQTYQFYYDGTNWVTILDFNSNTDTKVNVTLETTTKAYLLGTSVEPTATASAVTTISDTGVYLDTSAGQLTATSFNGDGAQLSNINGSNVSKVASATLADSANAIEWVNVANVNSIGNFNISHYNDNDTHFVPEGALEYYPSDNPWHVNNPVGNEQYKTMVPDPGLMIISSANIGQQGTGVYANGETFIIEGAKVGGYSALSNWRVIIGPHFGVTDDGTLYVNSGKIGNWDLIYGDTGSSDVPSVPNGSFCFDVSNIGQAGSMALIPSGTLYEQGTTWTAKKLSVGGQSSADWRIIVGSRFGVDKYGNLYTNGGRVGGWNISVSNDAYFGTGSLYYSNGWYANDNGTNDYLKPKDGTVVLATNDSIDGNVTASDSNTYTVTGIRIAGSDNKKDWRLIVGPNFGVDKTGTLYANKLGNSWIDVSSSVTLTADTSSEITSISNKTFRYLPLFNLIFFNYDFYGKASANTSFSIVQSGYPPINTNVIAMSTEGDVPTSGAFHRYIKNNNPASLHVISVFETVSRSRFYVSGWYFCDSQ